MPNLTNICNICKTEESKSWWKCCSKHTTERDIDVVCESCANRCINGKEETNVWVGPIIPLSDVIEIKKPEPKQAFAERMANYVETHKNYSAFTKREAVVVAFRVLTEDIGAAQDFCNVIGLKIDLYDEDLYKE